MRSKEKIPSTCNTSVMGDVYPGLIYNSKSRDSNSSAFNNSQSQESISNIRTPSSQRGSSHSRNKEEATHSHQPSITSSTRSPPAEIRRKECDSVILPEIIGGWHSLQHHKDQNGTMIKPIAFKPVGAVRSGDVSSRPTPTSCYTPHSCDDGYGTHELSRSRSHSNSVSNSIRSDRETDIYASPIPSRARALHKDNSRHNILISTTPISLKEYETMLQDKEAEMARVRETMELNESAILKVQERKRIDWENQMKDLSQEYHRHLRLNQDQAAARENDLRSTVVGLKQENEQLVGELDRVNSDSYHSRDLSEQLDSLHKRNIELNHRLTQSSCECTTLSNKAKELESQNGQLCRRLEAGHAEQRRLEKSINNLEQKLSSSSEAGRGKLEQLQQQVRERDKRLEEERDNFELEREKWREEKVKVLQYQKQLQETYVNMYRRNTELEQQLCRVSSRQRLWHRGSGVGRESMSSVQRTPSDGQSILNMDLESNPESFC